MGKLFLIFISMILPLIVFAEAKVNIFIDNGAGGNVTVKQHDALSNNHEFSQMVLPMQTIKFGNVSTGDAMYTEKRLQVIDKDSAVIGEIVFSVNDNLVKKTYNVKSVDGGIHVDTMSKEWQATHGAPGITLRVTGDQRGGPVEGDTINSVSNYGAVGDDFTDNSDVFNDMEADPTKDRYYLPEGIYRVPSPAYQLKKTYWGPGILKLIDRADSKMRKRKNVLDPSRAITVTVFPKIDNASNVLLPDGTWLDVSKSRTSGLQEAVNYAFGDGTRGSGHYDLHVVGGEARGDFATSSFKQEGGGIVYDLQETLVIPPVQGHSFSMGACTLNCHPTSGPAILFDSTMMVRVDWRGTQVVNHGRGSALKFFPRSNLPLDSWMITNVDSSFYITTVFQTGNSGNAPVIDFDISKGAITNCRFIFDEINNGDDATSDSKGIAVSNPPEANRFRFHSNKVTCFHVHNWGRYGLAIYDEASGKPKNNISNNHWDLRLQSGHNIIGSAAVYTEAGYDIFNIGVEDTTCDYFISLAENARHNLFNASYVAGNAAGESSINNNSKYKGTNKLVRTATPTHTLIKPEGSPYIHQNKTLTDQLVIVQGGAMLANVFMSLDGITYYDTGNPYGQFYLPPGYFIKVRYKETPQISYYQL
ncbi:hypothetical protein P0136_12125 [Lentisphaerota bacterium ZTH]|nr:hypothetical protein JYG24_10360 [Lentisphaerota bacterium]WET06105.1 hypothetical protein P0136_12125 [Lentisphaerota bacterium ZTH]